MPTPLENAVEFLRAFGFFNVVLPFILVFALVFGILEKTRIFGEAEHKGQRYPKTNLNSMVAFAIAFFVIAASNIVDVIQTALPQISLVLVIIITLLLLTGSFYGDSEFIFTEKYKKLRVWVMIIILLIVLAIFLNAMGTLTPVLGYLAENFTSAFVGVLFLLILASIAIYIIIGKPRGRDEEEKKGG